MICTMYAPWFGKLPFYKDVFIECCGKSENILWIIHSDQIEPDVLPKNVKWFFIDDLNKRLSKYFEFEIKLKIFHKLCDLKPFWHLIFKEDFENTKYCGWCDWDVVHDLSKLEFNFESAKFTNSWQCSPIFITQQHIDVWPKNIKLMFHHLESVAWDELFYLTLFDSKIIQRYMNPEHLFSKADFAVHMYVEKQLPILYKEAIKKYCNFEVKNIWF